MNNFSLKCKLIALFAFLAIAASSTMIAQNNPYYPNTVAPPTIQQTTNDSTGAIEVNICAPDANRTETFSIYKEINGVRTLVGSGTLENDANLSVTIPNNEITDDMILEVTSKEQNSNAEFIEWRDTAIRISNLDVGKVHNDILSYVFSQHSDYTTSYDFMESAFVLIHEYFIYNDIMNSMNMYNISTQPQHFTINDLLDTTHGIPYIYSELVILASELENGNLQYAPTDEITPSVKEISFALMAFDDIFTQDFTNMQADEVFDAIIQKANHYQSLSNAINWQNKEGYVANACLSVAKNSALYWKDYVGDLDEDIIPEPNLLPAWVAFDAGGALGGALKEVVGSKMSGQKITAKNVAKSALIGAAFASVGAALKGARAIASLFR